jgi:hypothetical protein
VKTAAEYRQRAALALEKEAAMDDPAARAEWLEIARVWICLAEIADIQESIDRGTRTDPSAR